MQPPLAPWWPDLYLSWQDVADILVISFLIQRLLLLFRGSTSMQAVVGLLSLWLIHAAARSMGLVLTSRFLEALGTVAVLVVVVVFRNEIRDVLIQTSPLRLVLGRPAAASGPRRLPALVEAVYRMAAVRTGALIVLQNRSRLHDRVQDGVVIDAPVSTALLEAIFQKDGPMHDGAVLIRGNRIERAGSILPLSRRPSLPMEFGTRHRAAIGLSESCDAVVLVVSEERGEVTLVHDGQHRQVDDPAELEDVLRRLLRNRDDAAERQRGWRREAFRQVGSYVGITLLVAAYWGVYFGRQLSMINVTRAIDFRNLPEGLELRSTSDEEATVQVSGRRPLIEALKPEQVVVYLDLRGLTHGGLRRARLGPENVDLPLGLKAEQVTPGTLVLNLEQRRTLARPVVPRLRGAPPAGFRVNWAVQPPTVVVSAAASEIEGISVPTEPVDLKGLGADHPSKAVKVGLATLPGTARLESPEEHTVTVTLTLVPDPPPAPAPAADAGRQP